MCVCMCKKDTFGILCVSDTTKCTSVCLIIFPLSSIIIPNTLLEEKLYIL